ncbi:MAG: MFS transporter [Solobacterium sp.]|nr:MFS transporter [Solobacterium sp.]
MKDQYQSTIYACYLGYITQAIVNNLAPLLFVLFIDRFSLSLGTITLLTTFNFFTQLCVDILSAKFVDRIGYRVCAVAAHVFCSLGLLCLAVLPGLFQNAFIGLLISCILYAIGGGLIEVIISPIVEACPSEHKASAMSLLHSFYCWGSVSVILISTLVLKMIGHTHWQILPVIWACIPFFNAIWFTKVPILTLVSKEEGMSIKELLSSKLFWLFFFAMIASGASELSMSQWASAFAEKGLHVSKTMGDICGPCFFAVLMGLSRVFYGKNGEKINLMKFIQYSSLLCVGSYLLCVFSPSPLFSLLGCGLCGLSVGIMWPGVFSLAASKMPKGGTAMFALLALAGDVGCTCGPTLVGRVADLFQDNLKTGFLFAMCFPVVLYICIIILKKAYR